jgi:hypothetical protein
LRRQGGSPLTSVFFTGEISPNGDFFFKNANFGDFFSKTHFLIAKNFFQFDPFSSYLTIFHPFEQIFIKL